MGVAGSYHRVIRAHWIVMKTPTKITKAQRIIAQTKVRVGTFPGMGRSRKFKDRKKEANRQACRNKVNY